MEEDGRRGAGHRGPTENVWRGALNLKLRHWAETYILYVVLMVLEKKMKNGYDVMQRTKNRLATLFCRKLINK